MNERALRMRMDYLDIKDEDAYSEAYRDVMLAILKDGKDGTAFTDEVKINTLLGFHKDTCTNFLLGLYPSEEVASQDIKILKDYVDILKDINKKHQLILQKAILESLIAEKQLFQMKTAMSVFLKSSLSHKNKGFKEWMLENSQFKDEVDYRDDDERLERVGEEIQGVLANLRSLGDDISKYHPHDGDLRFQFRHPNFIKSKYKLLEYNVKTTSKKALKLLESGHPCFVYLIDLEGRVEMLEKDLKEGKGFRKSG